MLKIGYYWMENIKIVNTAWENPNVTVYCHVRKKNATNHPQIHKIILQNIKYAYDLINVYNDTNLERMQTAIQKENNF